MPATPTDVATDLADRSASDLARMIRAREVTSVEVLDVLLARIAALDPSIRAIVTLDAERARAAAERADTAVVAGRPVGRLHGVPLTIKDMHRTAGLRTTFGLPGFGRHVPRNDSAAVARLRAAGAIVFGKTNVPLAGYDWQTRHPKFGPTRNPWDLARTPGGSSGGGAAALACGFTPLELGSDLGGSIRVPAHFCGVCGLKPTEGRVPTEGQTPEGWGSLRNMLVVGPLARTVEDLRLAFRVVAGLGAAADGDGGAGGDSGEPTRPRPLRELRFAWTDSLCGVPASADTRRALEQLAARLQDAGAAVECARPSETDGTAALEIWGGVDGFEFVHLWPPPLRWSLFRQMFRLGPVALAVGRSAFSRALARGMASGPRGYFKALERRDEFARAIERFLEPYDAWLCPAAATPAFTHRRRPASIDVDGEPVPYSLAQSAFCCPFNVSGHPVVVVPIGRSAEGLPIGVQVVGRLSGDEAALDAAAEIERLTGRFGLAPLPAPPGAAQQLTIGADS